MAEARLAGAWHPDEDVLVEVCLGHADPRMQEEVTAHLAGCTPCRASYAELADAVEAVLPAGPRVAPPPGFEDRVLTAVAGQVGEGTDARPVRRRTILWAAAAGVLGAAAGTGVTAYLGRDREPATGPLDVPPGVPLLSSSGAQVGTVAPAYDDRGPVLVVDVLEGEPGLALTCLLALTDGEVEDMGRWELSPGGPHTWVVSLGDYQVARVDLVGDDGSLWARAVL